VIPGTVCHLVIKSQTIHSHHRIRILTRRGHQRLLQYIGDKLDLAENIISQLIGIAMPKPPGLSTSPVVRSWSSSFTSGFLSVNKRIDTIPPSTPVTAPAAPVEDFDQTKLLDQSNRNPVLANIILKGLYHWFHQTPQSPMSPYPPYDGLIASQTQIGWRQLLLGR
jgi:hypothetical protein